MTESEKPKQSTKRNWGLWIIVAALLVACFLFLLPLLPDGDSGDSGSRADSNDCSLTAYRSEAEPLMEELSGIIDDTSIGNASSRATARTAVAALLRDINGLECKNAFPLKHETLEFAASHFRDALTAMDDGDATEADQALNRAIFNAQRFNNWSVDVSN